MLRLIQWVNDVRPGTVVEPAYPTEMNTQYYGKVNKYRVIETGEIIETSNNNVYEDS